MDRAAGCLSFFMCGAGLRGGAGLHCGAGLHYGADMVQMKNQNMEYIEYMDQEQSKSSTI